MGVSLSSRILPLSVNLFSSWTSSPVQKVVDYHSFVYNKLRYLKADKRIPGKEMGMNGCEGIFDIA